ncbi:MAG TPA: hypothetical protein VMV22_07460 [Acidimicrobiales bacterium]|nr:hypothetical protein [Acidimicrobiales bacterium]
MPCLDVAVITEDPTHRYRAIGNLTGLTAAFMLGALVVMGGQNHQAVGTEVLIVSSIAGAVLVCGYIQARRFGGSGQSLSNSRMIGGSICHLLEMVGR